MDALPDFGTLSDDGLRALIHDLVEEEQEVSFRRRMLHGRIDILRAELVARLQQRESGGEGAALRDIDVARLTAILTAKAMPPADDEAP
ncbi:MAG: hypothetical protein H0T39_03030 [Actinobacteria bacterium]|nr:hypothetical protein [Actinomycetota bacterium]